MSLSLNPLAPPSQAQAMPTSPPVSLAASGVHTQYRTMAEDMLERHEQVVTPAPPLASVRPSQSHGSPDIADAPHNEASGPPVNTSLPFNCIHRSAHLICRRLVLYSRNVVVL